MSLTITSTDLECVAGVNTLLALVVDGAEGPVTWELTDVPHAVPSGMQLTSQGVTGIPSQVGTFEFRVTATDTRQPFAQSATVTVKVTVNDPPAPEEQPEPVAPPPPPGSPAAEAEAEAEVEAETEAPTEPTPVAISTEPAAASEPPATLPVA